MIAFLQEFTFELIFGVLSIISACVINQMYRRRFRYKIEKGEDGMSKTNTVVELNIKVNVPEQLAILYEDGKISIADLVVLYYAIRCEGFTVETKPLAHETFCTNEGHNEKGENYNDR